MQNDDLHLQHKFLICPNFAAQVLSMTIICVHFDNQALLFLIFEAQD